MVVLVILNIALLLTLWLGRTASQQETVPGVEMPDGKRIEDFLRSHLKFSPEQMERFREMQNLHLPKANALRLKTYR